MLLEFKDIDTYYGDLHVLKQVNYTLGEGEIVSLLGGNACGKSTTMKTIMGVVRPTRGTVIYQGVAIERMPTRAPKQFSKRDVGYTDDHGDSPEQCSKCEHFGEPSSCEIVAGEI